MERRTLLTTTLFVDFGEGFVNGKLQMTAGQLLNTTRGPDIIGGAISGSDIIEFQSLRGQITKNQIDYNGDGKRGDAADFKFLRDTVIKAVQRIYSPFDVVVKEARASTVLDVSAAYNLNRFDPTGEHDSYVFATGIVDQTVGARVTDLIPIYGIASDIDLTSGPGGMPGNNDTDESVIVCADALIEDSLSYGYDLGAAIANVVAHEAGHTFALRHTVGVATPLFPDQALQNQSDIIRAGGDNPPINLFNIGMITRFNLMADYYFDPTIPGIVTNFQFPTITVNSFDKLATDPDIGLKANNFAYVTGTGAYDEITITRVDDTMALVSVQTYRNSSYSSGAAIDVGPYTYLIDYTNGIVIEGGRSDDRIQIDSSLGVHVDVRGGEGQNQLFVFSGGNPDVTFTPDADPAYVPGINDSLGGRIVTSGGAFGTTTIDFTEFVSDNLVVLDGFTNLDYSGPQTGHLDLTLNGSVIDGRVAGPSGIIETVGVRYVNVANLVIDTRTVLPDVSIDTNDVLMVTGIGFASPGLQNFQFLSGRGNDKLVMAVENFTLPVPGGQVLFDAGDGLDTIGTDANSDFILTDDTLTSTKGGVVQLMNLFGDNAEIGGGGSNNSFFIQSWSGTGTVDGQGGDDRFFFGTGSDIDTFTGVFTVVGGRGNDVVTLDDSANFDDVNYNIGKTRVTVDGTTPTDFGRVYWNDTLENLVMTGTLGKNVYFVQPNLNITVKIDALDPPGGTPPLEGDQLSVFFASAEGRKLLSTGSGNGIWTFTSGHKPIYFDNIEYMGSLVAAAANAGDGKPLVKVYNSLTNRLMFKFYAYEESFKGGVEVTMADVSGDGILDVIAAPGAGRRGEVKVFDSALLQGLANSLKFVANPDVAKIGPSIIPEGTDYRSGLHVAAGDVDGDGDVDVITSRMTGRGKIRVYEKTAADNYHRTLTFTPYSSSEGVFRGAVLAVGDVDGDGRDEIVTAPGAGASARIKVWEGESGERTRKFFGFESSFKNGVSLAIGDANGDGLAEIFVGAGGGGRSRVRTFSQFGTLKNEFRAYTSGNINAPVQLAARASDPNDNVALYLGQGNDGRTNAIRVLNPLTGALVDAFLETDPDFQSGISMG